MISKWRWLLLQLTRKLWVRAGLLALLAAGTALLATVSEEIIPGTLPARIGADAVDHVLDILASSMLAVTTFSLSVMVSAYGAATTNVTPRATRLLMQDTTSQNVLATFIGTFLFSLVGIVALSTGAYGERGRLVLFVVTLAVILLVVLTILRWIEHLSRLGRVGETTQRVEEATREAIVARARNPNLGGKRLAEPERQIPKSATRVFPSAVGYVQHVDVAALSELAEERNCDIFIEALPGAFVHPARPVASIEVTADETLEAAIGAAFTIGEERSFDQDPRFGLVVLAEIASRALSPAINDPGTAIDVVGRAVRLLARWHQERAGPEEETVSFPRLWVPALRIGDLFDDIFAPIARDGAGILEVQLRLQKAFHALACLGGSDFAADARRHAGLALERAEAALPLDAEKERVREAARRLKP